MGLFLKILMVLVVALILYMFIVWYRGKSVVFDGLRAKYIKQTKSMIVQYEIKKEELFDE